ncbi:MAG: hypothetical protein NVS2B14_20780 [Chamaesiphon sp.]
MEEFTMETHMKRLQKIYEKAILDFYDQKNYKLNTIKVKN